MNENKIIIFDSDEAAQKKTVTGWVSGNGFFYGDDERSARFMGCTHIVCHCGLITRKENIQCESCRNKYKLERYRAMPFKEWNGTDFLYSESADKYFYDSEDISDYCEEEGIPVESLRFIICEPVYPEEINLSEIYSNLLPDDSEGELPEYLIDAENELNRIIREEGEPLSWMPGKYRTEVKEHEITNFEARVINEL